MLRIFYILLLYFGTYFRSERLPRSHLPYADVFVERRENVGPRNEMTPTRYTIEDERALSRVLAGLSRADYGCHLLVIISSALKKLEPRAVTLSGNIRYIFFAAVSVFTLVFSGFRAESSAGRIQRRWIETCRGVAGPRD